MIRTENYLIFPGPAREEFPNARIKYDCFFNPQENPAVPESHLNFHTVKDLGGKGIKYLVTENTITKKIASWGINHREPSLPAKSEILEALSNPNSHLNFEDRITHPSFNIIKSRDERLQTLFGTFPWLTNARIYFIGAHYVIRLLDSNFKIIRSLRTQEKLNLSDNAKSTLVELEIYENDFLRMTTTLELMHRKHPRFLNDISFSFDSTKGLL